MSVEEVRHRGFVHVTTEDVTDAHTPTLEQARAIDLLELNPDGRPTVRLSLAQWRHVDRVVLALGALGVPAPRAAVDDGAGSRPAATHRREGDRPL